VSQRTCKTVDFEIPRLDTGPLGRCELTRDQVVRLTAHMKPKYDLRMPEEKPTDFIIKWLEEWRSCELKTMAAMTQVCSNDLVELVGCMRELGMPVNLEKNHEAGKHYIFHTERVGV